MINKTWDVIVIGGGPSGMMGAGRAAERGKSVLLLEKNDKLGKKLLITGGGRCNITNNKPNLNTLVKQYKNSPKALYSVFSQFDVDTTLAFFKARGLDTIEENEGRLFPSTEKAESVWKVMKEFIEEFGVEVLYGSAVKSIKKIDDIFAIETENSVFKSKKCIVATGGTSKPETGSTGDAYAWMESLGHKIIPNDYSLVPLTSPDEWVKKLSGVVIRDVKISIWQAGKKHYSDKGKILFTHFGVSGPSILNMSSRVRDLVPYGNVDIKIDLKSDMDDGMVKDRLIELIHNDLNKMIKNTLTKFLPKSLVLPILEIAKVDPSKSNNTITKEERLKIRETIKALPIRIDGLLGSDKAIVSSGGVDIDEVNFQTMESRLVRGLYIIGDMLNIDRPSGGYSLQICWSSGFVAGDSC